ncbi:hypothetical protein A2U01_0111855, partial [Trifolium medium]|nr:hypothetical protein [Trifolium medium]
DYGWTNERAYRRGVSYISWYHG